MRTLFTCLLAVLAMLNAAASRADAQAAFARMRSLVGEWRAPLSNNETMIDIFRPIAFGTALLHEEWKNGEQLTATVFYVVGSELRADHYCDMGNQLHYVDESDERQTENQSYKRKVKKIRTAALRKGKPTLLVAHIRKGDRRYEPLVPTVEDFHGSSDIPKIATKAIMLAPAFDQPNDKPFLWNTYFQIAKCRLDGTVTRYCALCTFNSRTNDYESNYTLGRLVEGGKKFDAVDTAELPGWTRRYAA